MPPIYHPGGLPPCTRAGEAKPLLFCSTHAALRPLARRRAAFWGAPAPYLGLFPFGAARVTRPAVSRAAAAAAMALRQGASSLLRQLAAAPLEASLGSGAELLG